MKVLTCKDCEWQFIPDGDPDPVFCKACDCDDLTYAEEKIEVGS